MPFYAHWRDVPAAAWRWPNFSPAEIACRGTGKLLLNEAALDKLQALRNRLGKPLILRSAYRSPEHNRSVSGAKASKHLEGIAFDIAMANHDPEAFEDSAREIGFRGFGFYPRSGFIHIDLGPVRSWGERFPKRATAFAVETPPARGTGGEPHPEGRGCRGRRDDRRGRGRGGPGGAGRDAGGGPAAGAISRHACLMRIAAPVPCGSRCPPRHLWRAAAGDGSVDTLVCRTAAQ